VNRTALIFGGGRATRLGGVNKALLEVGGRPIVDRILSAVNTLVDETVLLTNDATLQEMGSLKLVYDPTPHAGVLTALATGLAAAAGDICIAVACDMPFVSRRLFEALLDMQQRTDADVVIPRTRDFLEPMHAVYRRASVEAAIRQALERGDQRMTSYFKDVRVEEVPEADWQLLDPAGLAFFNVNTPEDLAEARLRASARAQEPGQG
jgi:molybdenum cofactor guanylyltransferase